MFENRQPDLEQHTKPHLCALLNFSTAFHTVSTVFPLVLKNFSRNLQSAHLCLNFRVHNLGTFGLLQTLL